jgi:hypothetical protein
MADYRRHFEDGPRRLERDPADRLSDDAPRWFRDEGMYRTDDRAIHERYRHERLSPSANESDRGHAEADAAPAWLQRERGGYWRQYAATQPNHKGRGPRDYVRSDDRIREEICDRMTDDVVLDASDVTVEVKQGEVTLGGSVTSREQKRRAEDVAEGISGVRDVTNQLRITRDANGHYGTVDSPRASGSGTASSQPVTQASGKGTPSNSTTSSTA